MLMVEAA